MEERKDSSNVNLPFGQSPQSNTQGTGQVQSLTGQSSTTQPGTSTGPTNSNTNNPTIGTTAATGIDLTRPNNNTNNNPTNDNSVNVQTDGREREHTPERHLTLTGVSDQS